jgi:hypothetical protein
MFVCSFVRSFVRLFVRSFVCLSLLLLLLLLLLLARLRAVCSCAWVSVFACCLTSGRKYNKSRGGSHGRRVGGGGFQPPAEASTPIAEDAVLKGCAAVEVLSALYGPMRDSAVAICSRSKCFALRAPRAADDRLVASLTLTNVDDVILKAHQRIQETPLPAKNILLTQFVGMVVQHAATDANLMCVALLHYAVHCVSPSFACEPA